MVRIKKSVLLCVILYFLCFQNEEVTASTRRKSLLDMGMSIIGRQLFKTRKRHANSTTGSELLMDTAEKIRFFKYPAETHKITTEDGYILTVFRIPSDAKGTKPDKVALLQHGLSSGSDMWLVQDRNKCLPLILADSGYDVWISNIRGSSFSLAHTKYSSESPEFWDFSFHEMGVYDIPAIIDYILEKTNHKKLHYIGHSMGTTMFFVMASQKPEYNEKIRSMHALAPVAFMTHARNPFLLIARAFHREITDFLDQGGYNKISVNRKSIADFISDTCGEYSENKGICARFVSLHVGFDEDQVDFKHLAELVFSGLHGCSKRTLYHYYQMYVSGKFELYNFNRTENLRRYNQETPPEYDISKISCPVALYYSNNDFLADVSDVQKLSKLLPNLLEMYNVPYEQFSHLDFMMAINVKSLLYDRIVSNMKKN